MWNLGGNLPIFSQFILGMLPNEKFSLENLLNNFFLDFYVAHELTCFKIGSFCMFLESRFEWWQSSVLIAYNK